MAPREVYLSPFEAGVLYGAGHVVRRSSSPNSEKTDLFRLFCTTLMQAGAGRFLIPGGEPSAFTASAYLQERISNARHSAADSSWALTRDAFEQYFVGGQEERSVATSAARRLQYLVSDLVRSLESGTSMAMVAPLPDLNAAAKILPPDVIVPTRILLEAISSAPAVVPVPKANVAKRDIALLAEVLQSDAYMAYQGAHQELETLEEPTSTALEHVAAKASALTRAAGQHLDLGERVVSLLPASAKLIEELWGKVPGALAEALTKPLETWLRARTRLVVYRFDSVLTTLVDVRPDPPASG